MNFSIHLCGIPFDGEKCENIRESRRAVGTQFRRMRIVISHFAHFRRIFDLNSIKMIAHVRCISRSELALRKCLKQSSRMTREQYPCLGNRAHTQTDRQAGRQIWYFYALQTRRCEWKRRRMPTMTMATSLHCWTLNNRLNGLSEYDEARNWRCVVLTHTHTCTPGHVLASDGRSGTEEIKREKNPTVMNKHFNRKWN